MENFQICTRCVMDTTDSKIVFDENGVCDHCNDFEQNVKPNWFTDERGDIELKKQYPKLKKMAKIVISIASLE